MNNSWEEIEEDPLKDLLADDDISEDDELEESPTLYEHFRFVADKGQSLLRVDKFLVDRMMNATRNRIQLAAEAGAILVNGTPVKSNYRVKPMDVVTLVMTRPRRELEIIPENIPLNIVYEDDDLLFSGRSLTDEKDFQNKDSLSYKFGVRLTDFISRVLGSPDRGVKSERGDMSRRAVINALLRFKEFLSE